MTTLCRRTLSMVSLLLIFSSGQAVAQDEKSVLKIGLSAEPTSVDPHFHNTTNNNQLAEHIYEPLVTLSPQLVVGPGLAESHRLLDSVTWELKLRKNVKFHDGSAFDANDVIFSFCRVPLVANSPGSFVTYTGSIADIVAKDPHTIVIKTKLPYPMLPRDLSTVRMISDGLINGEKVTFAAGGCKISAQWPETKDFNSGKNAIGTGPMKFSEYVKGDRVVLKRNDAYWGKKTAWDTVIFRPIQSHGPRMAALLSGDVDVIENPPPQDILRLWIKDSKHKVVSTTSNRHIYVGLDQRDDATVPPGVKGTNGKNPFRDIRVRKALSMAINRESIAKGVMLTFAKPAEQLLAKGYEGVDPLAPALRHDPEGAKKLLAEAGYPKGFEVTLATTNDRYMNDAQVAQAIAQMWTRIGVKTNVNAMTVSVFTPKLGKNEFGIWMYGWGPRAGEISTSLRALVGTKNKEKGWGVRNDGLFSDRELDALIEKASVEMDDTKRTALLHQASKMAVEKVGVIPIHHEVTPWAMRNEIDYVARGDQYTLAFEMTPAKKR